MKSEIGVLRALRARKTPISIHILCYHRSHEIQ